MNEYDDVIDRIIAELENLTRVRAPAPEYLAALKRAKDRFDGWIDASIEAAEDVVKREEEATTALNPMMTDSSGLNEVDHPFYFRAVRNIAHVLEDLLKPQGNGGPRLLRQDVATACGMSASTFTSKMRCVDPTAKSDRRIRFSEDEFEALAVFFRPLLGRPLTGFPHLAWDYMETLDRMVEGMLEGKPEGVTRSCQS